VVNIFVFLDVLIVMIYQLVS